MAPNASFYLSTPVHSHQTYNPPLPLIPSHILLQRPKGDESSTHQTPRTNDETIVPDKPYFGKFPQLILPQNSNLAHTFIPTYQINESDHPLPSMTRLGTALSHNPCNNNETVSTPTNKYGYQPSTPLANIWPYNSLSLIHTLATIPSRDITQSHFIFEPTIDAVHHNSRYLQSFQFDISTALATECSSFTARSRLGIPTLYRSLPTTKTPPTLDQTKTTPIYWDQVPPITFINCHQTTRSPQSTGLQ